MFTANTEEILCRPGISDAWLCLLNNVFFRFFFQSESFKQDLIPTVSREKTNTSRKQNLSELHLIEARSSELRIFS